jgi:hypothetical protein
VVIRFHFAVILVFASFPLAVTSAYPNDRPGSAPALASEAGPSASTRLQTLTQRDSASLHLTLASPHTFSVPPSSKYLGGISQNNSDVANSTGRVTVHSTEHNFWDRQNKLLFGAVAASRTLDYFSTLNMRRRGLQEVFLTNDIVDNHAAFAAIEAGGTAVSIGASYLFHHYHHHRLERWTSIVHASLATSGAVRNYCLKTAHPSTTP